MKEPVIVAEYDPRWPVMFEEEKTRLLGVIGHVVEQVEHVGSTAVPGLGAKPIIDILIGLRRLDDAAQCIAPLQSLGYQYVPEYEVELPERRYFRKGSPKRTHHLHMVTVGTEFWERHLLFRDYLRVHPETAREYYELKKALAAKFGSDRDGYTDAKTEFVRSVEAEARSRL
jgi:GrpB-like predicted nucleotidyltransferase (UPF0157 family)